MKLLHSVLAVLLLARRRSSRRATPGGQRGRLVATGHVHLTVSDVEKAKSIWLAFGAKEIKSGKLQALQFPGIYVMITQGAPTAGSGGSVIDHIGSPLRTSRSTSRSSSTTARGSPPRTRTWGLVIGELPEGVLVEFRSEPGIAGPIEFHHFHLKSPDPDALQAWYLDTFGAEKSTRMNLPSAVVPGGRVDFLKTAAGQTTAPSKGRAIDHIGFEGRRS